ncbi:MAG: hypothetical protein HUU19_12020 [Phycisphaerales bacterium]|nr:hypothetical protein [Phycisphaerales bacterium]
MSGHCKGCGVYHEEDDDRLCGRCQDNKRARWCLRCKSPIERDSPHELCHECTVRKWDAMYTRPETLDRDEYWVSVTAVHESSGVREHETRWATLAIGRCAMESIAKDAALDWYKETDQSTDCDLSIRVDRYDGVTHVYRIGLAHELVARITSADGGAA